MEKTQNMQGELNRSVPRKKSRVKRLWDNRTLILMSLPAVLFFLVFCYLPMPGAYIAFTDFNYQKGIFASRFVGMDNFKFLWQSGKLWMLTRNTVLYNVAFIVLGKFSQSLMFLPYFISAVLVGLVAFDILNYDYGFIPSLVRGMGGTPPKFYSNPGVWPIIIILVNLWQSTGYGSIVYFATICGIDPNLMEAAAIDGANGIQRIRYILLPSLKPTVIILVLFSVGGILKGNFGLFYNLIGSANAALLPNTDIIETYVYRVLVNQFNFSVSAAAGLYQSVVGFALVMLANGAARKVDPDYALF